VVPRTSPSTSTSSTAAPAAAPASLVPISVAASFAAHFALLEEGDDTPEVDASLKGERDLGWMLHDIDFGKNKEARFFRAQMRDGVITVPPLAGATA
jgi:hypothetical protein